MQEKSYFFHLLAVMLDAGIPIMKALKVLSKKTDNPRFARIINTLAYDVERGKLLSQSMTKFPDVFKDAEVGIVRSGESIGNLAKLLFKLAKQTQRSHLLYLKVRGALIYPATVMVALLISGAIVVRVVIPRIDQFFTQSNFELPALTHFVLSFGRFVVNFSWLLAIGFVFLGLLLSFYISTESGRRRYDEFLLSAPFFSDVVRKLNVSRFVQILSLLIEAGVPIHEAIRIASGSMTNVLYKDYLLTLKTDVERGEKIAENLAEAPFLFPETVVAMIAVGENSGQIASISEKLASHYEDEVESSLETFTTLLEPIVIVIVGIAVGVLALALLGPIFSLSTLVS
ncbi:type II secretion system F family protein [Candidatus Peregrinibacteria bacterium]|nr:MAG: type II secretion system F family protein [Candidatus Peregrinibacteria bacterium]